MSRALARRPVFPPATLAMGIVVFTEVMFFTALISAFVVIRGNTLNWIRPRIFELPRYLTLGNTLLLLSSGLALSFALILFRAGRLGRVRNLFFYAIFSGIAFVVVQGIEWVQLIGFGLSLREGMFGALFFLLIGMHALHAASGAFALAWGYRLLRSGALSDDAFTALWMFWLLVVGIWPVLYGVVYF